METLGVLIGVVVGGALSISGQWMLQRRQRRDAKEDWSRTHQFASCVAFLEAANECSHELGLAAVREGDPTPSAEEYRAACSRGRYTYDSTLMPRIWAVKVLGSETLDDKAEAMVDELASFRKWIASQQVPPEHLSEPYTSAYKPFVDARIAFIKQVRLELNADPRS